MHWTFTFVSGWTWRIFYVLQYYVLAGYYLDLCSLHTEEKDLTLLFLLYGTLYCRYVKNFDLNDHLNRGGVISFLTSNLPKFPFTRFILTSY
jgi:hypothetical protein